MSNGPLFWAEYRNPENKDERIHQEPVMAVDLDKKLALILNHRTLKVVPMETLTWARWD